MEAWASLAMELHRHLEQPHYPWRCTPPRNAVSRAVAEGMPRADRQYGVRDKKAYLN